MATLTEAMRGETCVTATHDGYTVTVCESKTDDYSTGYDLSVGLGAMPPHAGKRFATLEAVEAYIASGEVLSMRELSWEPCED